MTRPSSHVNSSMTRPSSHANTRVIPKTGGKTTRKDIRVIPKAGGKTTRKDITVIPRQEAKPPGKTSELSQRQEAQPPKTGGKTTRKDIRVIPKAGGKTTRKGKPPGKTSELAQGRRQNHHERHQSDPKDGRQNHQERHQSYPKNWTTGPSLNRYKTPLGWTMGHNLNICQTPLGWTTGHNLHICQTLLGWTTRHNLNICQTPLGWTTGGKERGDSDRNNFRGRWICDEQPRTFIRFCALLNTCHAVSCFKYLNTLASLVHSMFAIVWHWLLRSLCSFFRADAFSSRQAYPICLLDGFKSSSHVVVPAYPTSAAYLHRIEPRIPQVAAAKVTVRQPAAIPLVDEQQVFGVRRCPHADPA